WLHGAATTLADFGTPLPDTGTSYALCIYDATSTVVARVRAPAGDLCGAGLDECWRQRRSALAYKDRERLPDGLKTLTLKAGDAGKAKIIAKAAGVTLAVPPLPATFPLVVQLVSSDGSCWQATYPVSGIRRND